MIFNTLTLNVEFIAISDSTLEQHSDRVGEGLDSVISEGGERVVCVLLVIYLQVFLYLGEGVRTFHSSIDS